jgi:hypothetical protein
VDGHEQRTADDQDAAELTQHGGHGGPWDVDEGVEAEGADERTIPQPERTHVPLAHRESRIVTPNLRSHAGRPVDPHHGRSPVGHEGTDMPGTAPQVTDQTPAHRVRLDGGSEACQEITVERLGVELMAEHVGIASGDDVVGGGRIRPGGRIPVLPVFGLTQPNRPRRSRPGGSPGRRSVSGGWSRIRRRAESEPKNTIRTTRAASPRTDTTTATLPCL